MSPRRSPDGRRRPDDRQGAVLGGEQVEGRQAVRELLVAGRRRVHEVVLDDMADRSPILQEIESLARGAGVPVRFVGGEEIAAWARSDVPQGVLARAEPVAGVELAELVRGAPSGRTAPVPFLVLLDGVTDPHNLGSVLRSASCAGATGIVLPKRRSVHLTPTVLKAAAGAVEYLSFSLVPGASAALQALRRERIWSIGLDEDGTEDLEEVAVLVEPIVLVLGAEGRGLAPLTRSRCDILARIPLAGPLPSLNVAAAGAVASFTVLRHRQSAPSGGHS